MTQKKQTKFVKVVEAIALLYLTLWTVSPPLQIGTVFRLAAVGAMGVLFLVRLNLLKKIDVWQACALLFLLLVIIVTVGVGGFSSILKPIAIYMLVLIYFLFYHVRDDWKYYGYLVPVVLILLSIWNFRSAAEVAVNPAIARLLVRDTEELYEYYRRGIGGYNLVYPQVCILPAIIAWTIYSFRKHKIFFAIGVVWAVSYFSFIPISGYTIAITTSMISLFMLFFYRQKNAVLALVISAAIIVLMVWMIGYVDPFREWLLRTFDGTKVAMKVNDIYMSIVSDETADSIYSRIVRYRASIQSIFITYPVFGGLFDGGAGGHSALLDIFAQYGIFGEVVYYNLIMHPIHKFKYSTRDKAIIRICNATFVSMMLVMTLDSAPYQFMMMITAIYPIILATVEDWRKPKNESSMDS